MTKYESKKNHGTFLTTDGIVDEKTKTMAVIMDDGKEKRISVSTLKRWWKKVEELEIEESAADQPETEKPETKAELESGEKETDAADQTEAKEPKTETEPEVDATDQEKANKEEPETKAETEADKEEPEAGGETEAETEEPETEAAQKTEAEEPAADQAEAKEPETEADRANAVEDDKTACHNAAKILEEIFNTINYIYFEDNLPKTKISVQNTPREYTRHIMQKIDKTADNGEFTYEINIGAKFMDKPVRDLAALLFHEITHIYCAENTIADTCQNGRYHNGKFKQQCEDRGLLVEYDLANGYAYVLPSEDFVRALKDSGIDMAMKFPHIEPTKKSRGRVGRKMFVYECPHCGQHFKAADELNIKCGKCNVIMECS